MFKKFLNVIRGWLSPASPADTLGLSNNFFESSIHLLIEDLSAELSIAEQKSIELNRAIREMEEKGLTSESDSEYTVLRSQREALSKELARTLELREKLNAVFE